jgi:uncharacterized protein YlxW (UPF0749 family)
LRGSITMLAVSRIRIPARFELKVPPDVAVQVLKARIAQGEVLLRGEDEDVSTLTDFRRAVERWQAENDGILDGMLAPTDDVGPVYGDPIPAASVLLYRLRPVQRLSSDLSADIRELSKLVYRIEIVASMPLTGDPPRATPQTRAFEVEHSSPPWHRSDELVADADLQVGNPPVEDPPAEDPPPVEDPPAEDLPVDDLPEEDPLADVAPELDHAESAADEPSAPEADADASLVAVAEAASAALAGYDADAVAERDLVGIERIVDAFSYLIAARTMQPPLAIGLFGQWGSGKTFLLRSIQRRVDQITRGARQSGRRQNDVGVFKRIVQIEFNAWHYVEGDLWASLVEHIFSNLRTSPEEGGSELERRRRTITRRLTSTRTQQRTLSSRIEQLSRRRAQRTQEVTELEQRQRARLQQLQRLQLRDIAAAVMLDGEDGQAVADAAADVGGTGPVDSAADALRTLADARELVSRGSALTAPMRRFGWKWALLLVLVVAVAPLCSLLLESLDVSSVTKVLASLGAFLSSAALVLNGGMRWASRSLTKIEEAERRVRARVEVESAAQAEELAALQHEIDGIEREIADVAREREAAASEIRELEHELAELTPGKVLAAFLEQRSDSGDYRRRLGITAVVRRDFEQLSQLVAANNEALLTAPDDAPVSPTDFNRVVLYVDDLDRCPPSRVVEVLQAVHLLLSFPIFVVVLAVDPRWLAQSLTSQYRDLLTGDAASRDGHATANDYLEKIFQIPFRVAPLDIEARARFVDGLLGDVDEVLADADAAATGTVEERDAGAAQDVYAATHERDDVVGTQLGEPADDERLHETLPLATPNGSGTRPLGPVDLNPASMRFTGAESRMLRQLLPLLETSPRSIKRFINIYRLIKSVAAIDGRAGNGSAPAAHECAMLLLAIQTGLPRTGPAIVDAAVEEPPASTLGDLVERIAKSASADAGASAEITSLRRWIAAENAASWPAAALSGTAEHVRLYAFG